MVHLRHAARRDGVDARVECAASSAVVEPRLRQLARAPLHDGALQAGEREDAPRYDLRRARVDREHGRERAVDAERDLDRREEGVGGIREVALPALEQPARLVEGRQADGLSAPVGGLLRGHRHELARDRLADSVDRHDGERAPDAAGQVSVLRIEGGCRLLHVVDHDLVPVPTTVVPGPEAERGRREARQVEGAVRHRLVPVEAVPELHHPGGALDADPQAGTIERLGVQGAVGDLRHALPGNGVAADEEDRRARVGAGEVHADPLPGTVLEQEALHLAGPLDQGVEGHLEGEVTRRQASPQSRGQVGVDGERLTGRDRERDPRVVGPRAHEARRADASRVHELPALGQVRPAAVEVLADPGIHVVIHQRQHMHAGRPEGGVAGRRQGELERLLSLDGGVVHGREGQLQQALAGRELQGSDREARHVGNGVGRAPGRQRNVDRLA